MIQKILQSLTKIKSRSQCHVERSRNILLFEKKDSSTPLGMTINRCLKGVVLSVFLIPHWGQSQNFGIGADAMYNFQTESIGAGARASIFPNNKLSFVPQFSYYFPFNKIQEYYVGLAVEYKLIKINQFHLYVLGHGAYNSWLNYESSSLKGAQQTNWNLEGGAGISTSKCLRPFLEYRYNLKFRETHLRLGLLYVFGCNGGRRIHERCPAYN